MITVVNKHWHKPTNNDIFIGRGSPLGNPYSHLRSSKENIINVATREEAIKKYADWLDDQYNTSASVKTVIDGLVQRELRGESTNLVCYCAPSPCHGEIIKQKILSLLPFKLMLNKPAMDYSKLKDKLIKIDTAQHPNINQQIWF